MFVVGIRLFEMFQCHVFHFGGRQCVQWLGFALLFLHFVIWDIVRVHGHTIFTEYKKDGGVCFFNFSMGHDDQVEFIWKFTFTFGHSFAQV